MRWGIIAALVFCCGFCAADEIDLEAVRETLDKAVDKTPHLFIRRENIEGNIC